MSYDPRVDGAVREAGATPCPRPKDAATLILVRRDRGGPEILMGRRSAGHRFMPNKVVFPGGRVDRADHHVTADVALKPATLAGLLHGATPSRARALALAAIRETFEETGLRLARAGTARGGGSAWRDFHGDGVTPALDALDYVARAITPPYRPKRFDARFFMADAHHLAEADLDRIADSRELLTLTWVTPEEALHLDVPNITRLVLREIAARLEAPHTPRPIPFTRMRHGKMVIEHLGPFPS